VRFLLALFAFVFASAAPARAALPALTLFTGTLQGETNITGFPPLKWTLIAEPATEDRKKSATLAVSAEGLSLRVKLEADLRAQTLAWRIDDGRLSLGSWFATLATRFAPSALGISLTGDVKISGEGAVENDRPTGRLSLSCADVRAQHTTDGWTLEGIDFQGAFTLASGFALNSASPATLTIKTISTSRFGARNLSLTGSVVDGVQALISSARVEIAGGEVEAIDPFTVPLSPLTIDTRLRIRRVGLQDFVALIPSGLSAARGKLHGDLRVTWSEKQGFQIGVGLLALDEVEPTIIRLARSPGFLTGSMPKRIEMMRGFLGRIFSVPNPSYKDLRDIELGDAELEVSSLRVQLSPDGDAQGRSAHVQVDARPLQKGGVVKRVTFDVNVDGPFSSLLRLGLNQPFTATVR
jgi:hypothetical protein